MAGGCRTERCPANLNRTEEVIHKMSAIALKTPGVENAVAFPGLSINGFTNSTSAGIVFVTLKPFDERNTGDLSGVGIAGDRLRLPALVLTIKLVDRVGDVQGHLFQQLHFLAMEEIRLGRADHERAARLAASP